MMLEEWRRKALNTRKFVSRHENCRISQRSAPNPSAATHVMTAISLALLLLSSVSSFTLHTRHMRRSPSFLSTTPSHQSAVNPSISSQSAAAFIRHGKTALLARKKEDASDTANNDDTNEWKAVLAAFTMYKAAYGDLKIPQRFVVPNMPPWPKAAWGLRLGKIVASMRATGKYILDQPERVRLLEELGFVWRVRKSSTRERITLNQLYEALKAYRTFVQPQGALAIPNNFVVPDVDPWPQTVRGLPMGQYMETLPQEVTKASAKVQEKFAKLGVSAQSSEQKSDAPTLSTNDIRFQNVYTALKTYKEIYGDLLVPQPFAVPEENDRWPEETWGLRLGARVNAIRSQGTFVNTNPERRQMLDELGFAWSPPKEGRRGRRTKDEEEEAELRKAEEEAALEAESIFDGPFDFDGSFDLSQVGEKTAPSWGLEGGVRQLQEQARRAEEEKQAAEEYKPPRTLAESLAEALDRAKEVGIVESVTENKRVVKGKREKDIPWFNDDFGDDFVFEDVVEALTLYKNMYGDFSNLTASEEFVIPAPKEKTGFIDEDELDTFDVDASARAARAIASFEEQGELDRSEDLIAAEIKRLQEEVGQSDTATETEMAVATETGTAEWPEHLAGMALGNIVARIRDGSLEVKHLPERKAKLDAIDFDWGDPKYFIDVPFEKAMCAMYAYYLVRGDMFVNEDFVMLDEDPWPQALAGYELGKDVKRIRELQNFFEAYHPEKVSLLRLIDFMWFPTMALPLDPNEPELTDEMTLLYALGHPDYAKMIDIPMGLPDKIIADGPFLDSDDPKDWWRKWHNWDYVKDYWYQQGRRDNAYVLRGMGYPQMADEHEAKYGPGLFTLINETMAEIEEGIDDRSLDDKRVILEKLNFYRGELIGCTDIHPQSRDELMADLDTEMLKIMKDSNLNLAEQDELESDDYEFEERGEEYEDVEEEVVDEDFADEFEYEEEEFDIEDELGLGGKQ